MERQILNTMGYFIDYGIRTLPLFNHFVIQSETATAAGPARSGV